MQNGINSERKLYLDGIKGITCFLVFLGHFNIAFMWQDLLNPAGFFSRLIMLISTGAVTVPMFCLISGYLIGNKKINSFFDYELTLVNRFLRFELPLLPVLFITIFLLKKTNLNEYATIFGSKLTNPRVLQDLCLPEGHFFDLIHKTFMDFANYNSALWMMKSLFIGGIILYTKNYVYFLLEKYNVKWLEIINILIYLALLALNFKDICLCSVLLGGVIFEYQNYILNVNRKIIWMFFSVLALPHIYIYIWHLDMSSFVFPRIYSYEGAFFALILFIFILTSEKTKNFCSNKLFLKMGTYSFGIYVLHNPVLSFFSVVIMEKMWGHLDYSLIVLISFVVSSVVIYILSALYNVMVEKPVVLCVKKVLQIIKEN